MTVPGTPNIVNLQNIVISNSLSVFTVNGQKRKIGLCLATTVTTKNEDGGPGLRLQAISSKI